MVLLAEGAARTLAGNPMSEEEASNLEKKLEDEGVFRTGALAAERAMNRVKAMKAAATSV
jgi:hypothetical protein